MSLGLFLNWALSSGTETEFSYAALATAVASLLVALFAWRAANRSIGIDDLDAAQVAAVKRIELALSGDQSAVANFIDIQLSVKSSAEDLKTQASMEGYGNDLISQLPLLPGRVIVTGDPGAGKSTLLRSLAIRMLAERNSSGGRVPIPLSCNTWSTTYSHLDQWACKASEQSFGIDPELFYHWIARDELLLILDGADEVSPTDWDAFVNQVNEWTGTDRKPVVLSCRTADFRSDFHRVEHDVKIDIRPVATSMALEYLQRAIARGKMSPPERDKLLSATERLLASSQTEVNDHRITPLLLRLIAEAVLNPTTNKSSADFGNQLLFSWLKNELGDGENSREIWEVLLALKHEEPHKSRGLLRPLMEHLSADERAILRSIPTIKSLDLFQVSSAASVPPSRCYLALGRLADQGFIEYLAAGNEEPRYRRLSANVGEL